MIIIIITPIKGNVTICKGYILKVTKKELEHVIMMLKGNLEHPG